jgi:hypothetical protein
MTPPPHGRIFSHHWGCMPLRLAFDERGVRRARRRHLGRRHHPLAFVVRGVVIVGSVIVGAVVKVAGGIIVGGGDIIIVVVCGDIVVMVGWAAKETDIAYHYSEQKTTYVEQSILNK